MGFKQCNYDTPPGRTANVSYSQEPPLPSPPLACLCGCWYSQLLHGTGPWNRLCCCCHICSTEASWILIARRQLVSGWVSSPPMASTPHPSGEWDLKIVPHLIQTQAYLQWMRVTVISYLHKLTDCYWKFRVVQSDSVNKQHWVSTSTHTDQKGCIGCMGEHSIHPFLWLNAKLPTGS